MVAAWQQAGLAAERLLGGPSGDGVAILEGELGECKRDLDIIFSNGGPNPWAFKYNRSLLLGKAGPSEMKNCDVYLRFVFQEDGDSDVTEEG